MKTKTVMVSMAIALVASISACKKDDAASSSALIIGKWTPVNQIHWTTTGETTVKDTTLARTGEYVDFRTDNKVYQCYWRLSNNDYKYDTANYKIDENNLIVKEGNNYDTAKIQTLTTNKLIIYSKYIYGTTTDETWSNLIK